MKQDMVSSLNRQFMNVESNELPILATLFGPCFKCNLLVNQLLIPGKRLTR